ncbi:MAG TPA: hypothetical protein VD927_14015 [Chryseosolibacter sp.]|nr:hypothetical protein [Chryseosolibacter sp.]
MKPVFKTIAICGLIFLSVLTNANILRVDSNVGNGAPYTTIQAAVDAAVAGDTIQIAGGAVPYSGPTVNKQLVFIGPGYFLGENPDTQQNKSPAKISDAFTFQAGSNGSFVMGLQFETGTYGIALQSGISNIVIKRNYFANGSYGILFNATSGAANSNIFVQQNYFAFSPWNHTYNYSNDAFLLNNYIGGSIDGLNNSSLTIKHNVVNVTGNAVFAGSPSNSNIQNNIFIFGTLPSATGLGLSNSFTNNLCDETIFGTADANQASVDMSTVFVVNPVVATPAGTSTDGRWMLVGGSPAIGAGASLEDCGMFGSADPYVLSGVPPIPAIYELIAPTSATQSGGLNINIKAKSRQ